MTTKNECLTINELPINYLFSQFSLNEYLYIYTLCTPKKDCNCLVTVSKQFFPFSSTKIT